LYCAEMQTLWKVDQKCLGSVQMWCWRRVEKISRNDHVRDTESRRRGISTYNKEKDG